MNGWSIGTLRAFALAIIVVLLTAPGATASVGWCRSDPVVKIGDDIADVFVSAPLDAPVKVTGPNKIIVTIPKDVSGAAVSVTPGFGRGEKVKIVRSRDLHATPDGIEVQIEVLVPASDEAMPVRVEFAPRVIGLLNPASAEGVANSWVTLRTSL